MLYRELKARGMQLLTSSPSGRDSSTESHLASLEERWDGVHAKVADRKVSWALEAEAWGEGSMVSKGVLSPGRCHNICAHAVQKRDEGTPSPG